MRLSLKYRIYLTRKQEDLFRSSLFFCNDLYNTALQERNSYYERYKNSDNVKKSLNYYDQAASLKEIESEIKIYSQTKQDVLKRVENAYKGFFRRVKINPSKAGFPRFKNRNSYNSLTFPQVDPTLSKGCIRLSGNLVNIFGLGEVKINLHRPIIGRCKTVMIKKEANRYYLIVSCDDVPIEPLPKTGKTCGIDLGIKSFVCLDDGTEFHHPKPYKTSKEKLAFLQQKLALKQSGSKKRRQVKTQIAKLSSRIVNIRKDFQHKLSKSIVTDYDRIAIEDLNIKSMIESKTLHHKESLAEASLGSFTQMILYKAERAGKEVVRVNPKNTSRTCSGCGNIKDQLDLKERIYRCSRCNLEIDRDQNAAKNIMFAAFGSNSFSAFGRDSFSAFGRDSSVAFGSNVSGTDTVDHLLPLSAATND